METVKYGMEGYDVKLLQYALKRAGMEAGDNDGIFGRRTLRALQRFQREKGLLSDGVAGQLTWAALYPYITGYALHRTEGHKAVTVPLDLPVVTDALLCSYLLTGLMVKGLCMRYPGIQAREIGRSVMGRPILSLTLGEGEKQVGCLAAQHADGWMTTLGLLRFLEDCAEARAKGGTIDSFPAQDILESVTLHLIPLPNPDGVDLVTGALPTMDSFYAQARALAVHYLDVPFPGGWQSNIAGVDLDLQYPNGWAENRRARFREGFTRPGPRGYVGIEPLITPENRAIFRWAKQHDFALTLSFDDGFARWFKAIWGRPCVLLTTATGESGSSLEAACASIRPHLVRALTFSP